MINNKDFVSGITFYELIPPIFQFRDLEKYTNGHYKIYFYTRNVQKIDVSFSIIRKSRRFEKEPF